MFKYLKSFLGLSALHPTSAIYTAIDHPRLPRDSETSDLLPIDHLTLARGTQAYLNKRHHLSNAEDYHITYGLDVPAKLNLLLLVALEMGKIHDGCTLLVARASRKADTRDFPVAAHPHRARAGHVLAVLAIAAFARGAFVYPRSPFKSAG